MTARRWLLATVVGLLTAGCTTEALIGGVGGATAILARSPSHELEQTYYLGVFDPDDQIPPSLYRVTVHGQASFMSLLRFASGWVPAPLADSLATRIEFKPKSSEIEMTTGDGEKVTLTPGRRLMMFGPEGFREAPAGHRLVVVMGSNPEGYFQAIDEALGTLAAAKREQAMTPEEQRRTIIASLLELHEERERLETLRESLDPQAKRP